jgi:hypothetical protein
LARDPRLGPSRLLLLRALERSADERVHATTPTRNVANPANGKHRRVARLGRLERTQAEPPLVWFHGTTSEIAEDRSARWGCDPPERRSVGHRRLRRSRSSNHSWS